MSGHSKWHTIKHKKGAADAKRGKIFTRIIKELTVAARNGGGDPGMNPRLRTIIADAKANNMPRENIERAIRRGTGEEPGVTYEEITYEGYGPGGVALLIQSLTDNKNRTVGEIRFMLGKYNGNLAAENSVAWMFSKKGQVFVDKERVDEEKLEKLSVADALNAIRAPAFVMELAGVGEFGGKIPRALWAGVRANDALLHLQKKIETALLRIGLSADERKFSPHITLARLKAELGAEPATGDGV